MSKSYLLAIVVLLSSLSVHAENANTELPDDEGFKQPLASLKFLRQTEGALVFNQATLELLDVPDPWESANRRLYHFNQRIDERLLLPIVKGYRFFLPDLLRQGITNGFSNLSEITYLSNSLLQLKGKRALKISGRLLINTTIGVAGFWDPATKLGLKQETEDFGQTLGFYGVQQGPYLMLPILGPSNVRDAGAKAVDFTVGEYVNFLNVAEESSEHREISALKVVNEREVTEFRYGQLNSPFEYEKLRYVFSRARELQVLD